MNHICLATVARNTPHSARQYAGAYQRRRGYDYLGISFLGDERVAIETSIVRKVVYMRFGFLLSLPFVGFFGLAHSNRSTM